MEVDARSQLGSGCKHLLHAVVEMTLGLTRGVHGMVNTGVDIAELLDPAQTLMTRARPS